MTTFAASTTGCILMHRSPALAVVLLVCAIFGTSNAQDVDEIVVIGTHIRQSDPDGPSPVAVFDRQSLARTGAMTVASVLERLPFGNNGSFNDSDALSTALGGSAISFRGLGANSVLVLVNGRRVAPYGFPYQAETLVSFVDLNSIPLGAVDKIEVLKDGASALYGSDAVAGVINIVMREDFSGVEVQAQAGMTAETGADEKSINVIWGHVGDTTSAEVIGNYSSRGSLLWRDREISRSADFTDRGGTDLRSIQSANFLIDSTWATHGAECEERGGLVAGIQDFEELDNGQCVYNPNTTVAEPTVDRYGLASIVNHEFSDTLTLHFEASWQHSEVLNQTVPALHTGPIFPSNNPWNPFPPGAFDENAFGELLLPYGYAFIETDTAIDRVNTDATRAVLALEGRLNRWVWELGALYSQSTTSMAGERGYLDPDRIEAALNGVDLDGNGNLQPDEYWNLYSSASNPNSQALADTLHTNKYRDSETDLASFDGLISGPILPMPAGMLRGAFGFEYRGESLHDESDQVSLGTQLARQFDPLFFGIRFDNAQQIEPVDFTVQELDTSFSSTAIGSRGQASVFTEFHIPFSDKLDLQAALRYEHYSDFGSGVNPRIAVRYQPSDRLTLRGSWGTGFRAPSLAELYTEATAELHATWDPMRCPQPKLVIDPFVACVLESFELVSSGNETLKPEQSESLSLGFTASLLRALAISANYWRIEQYDKIISPGLGFLLDNETQLGGNFVLRNPPSDEDIEYGFPGNIERVNNKFINAASQDVSGIDLDVTFSQELGRFGLVSTRLLWTTLLSSELKLNAADTSRELAGTYGNPRNRVNLDAYLATGDWQVGAYGRWTDGYDDLNRDAWVSSHTVWDLQVSNYSFETVTLTLGVDNLFDEVPPFSVGDFNPQGFNVQFYSMRGRMIYGRVTVGM
jgi:iron complex outermembrane receptor protein